MWASLGSMALIALISALTGCTAARLPDYAPLAPDEYRHHATREGLTIAIHPMTQPSEIERYFGTDLLAHDVLPVAVVVRNENTKSSFIIQRDGTRLLSGDDWRGPERRAASVGSNDAAEAVSLTCGSLLRP